MAAREKKSVTSNDASSPAALIDMNTIPKLKWTFKLTEGQKGAPRHADKILTGRYMVITNDQDISALTWQFMIYFYIVRLRFTKNNHSHSYAVWHLVNNQEQQKTHPEINLDA